MNQHPPERLSPNPKAKLRDQFHEVARYRQLSLRTEEAYWDWVHRYLLFCKEKAGNWRHPKDMDAPEVKAFLIHLATERRVAVTHVMQKPGLGVRSPLDTIKTGSAVAA